jgi:hypothetical protein
VVVLLVAGGVLLALRQAGTAAPSTAAPGATTSPPAGPADAAGPTIPFAGPVPADCPGGTLVASVERVDTRPRGMGILLSLQNNGPGAACLVLGRLKLASDQGNEYVADVVLTRELARQAGLPEPENVQRILRSGERRLLVAFRLPEADTGRLLLSGLPGAAPLAIR